MRNDLGELELLWQNWRNLLAINNSIAQKAGLTDPQFYILCYLASNPDCTQKQISDTLVFSKQHVNAVTLSFLDWGMVELRNDPADRRVRLIQLTEQGQAYVDRFIPALYRAASDALEKLSAEQRRAVLQGMGLYTAILKDQLKEQAPNIHIEKFPRQKRKK